MVDDARASERAGRSADRWFVWTGIEGEVTSRSC